MSKLQSDPHHSTCPTPTDFSPWLQQPFCLDPADSDDSGPPDCVFTSASFRGNQGVSIITTPELAASMVEYLDDSQVSAELKWHMINDEQLNGNKTRGYTIRDMPGRGKGAVAIRKLARHETVMVGFPAFIVRLDFLNDGRYTERQQRLMMKKAVHQLHPEQQRSIMSLARSTGGEPILDVLRTNGFGIDIGGAQHLAVFVDGSVCRLVPKSMFSF
ncbi:hypothetical protein VTJ83DRAFT_3138 [Remersonia thermophila]|uniref:Uncharacterized protein n=1 Tax=Remersonia thermophila TaxID=72144 RepID=A0ABR4DFD3_9PEZI